MRKKIILGMLIVIVFYLIMGIVKWDMNTIFSCLFALFLFLFVFLMKKRYKFDDRLFLMIGIFIFCTQILGQIYYFYTRIWFFDVVLHIYSSFIITYLCFYLFNRLVDKKILALVIFSMAMMAEGMWEICEFGIDRLFDRDMQKDTIVSKITSTYFSPRGDKPVVMYIDDVVVDGVSFSDRYGGYLDIGLYDTMEDMICALCGSVLFILIIKKRRLI